MKYNVTIYAFTDGTLLVDTDFYAETDRDATEYGLTLTPIPYGDSVKRRDADSIRSDQA